VPSEPDSVTADPASTEPGGDTTLPVDTSLPDAGTTTPETGVDTTAADTATSVAPAGGFRVATFNASLNRSAAGELVTSLSTPDDPQAANVAEIIQRVRPDILLVNEFDYVEGGEAVDLFRDNYLAVAHNGTEPIDYPYYFIAPSNTGVASGYDLDNDGTVGGPNDAFGFGEYEGQYGMLVLSRFPIITEDVRTFQNVPWSAMPDARLPDDPATAEPADWYSPEKLGVLRLSSKSHWDASVDVDGRIVHVLAAHPTPPVFDGEEDRNGTRNADEIRFWADYIAGVDTSWIVDDAGVSGGLEPDASFVILGDQNSDPLDGDSIEGAAQQLLDLDRVHDPLPTSEGAVAASEEQAGANAEHESDPAYDTADFTDDAPGNLRADYVLPSDDIDVVDAGVFWPTPDDELIRLVTIEPFASSDHRLVWVDLG
jgi:Endonuclease/Exonuclease/phosphatase family